MGELVELDVTTVEESVTVNVTEEGQVQISVVAETGPAGPAGPNSVTSATTSDGTCDLSLDTLTVGLSTVSGVRSVAIGQSTASGALSFASGASTASDDYCFANGDGSTASGYASTASGTGCTASGYASDASGDNTVSSGYASIASGSVSEATGDYSIALGRRAKAIHDGASVEADSQNADVESTTTDEKTFRFANGYRFLGGAVTIDDTLNCDHIHGNLAGSVYAHIRAGETLAKGDPVYVSGSHGSGATLIPVVSKADASNAAKMPAVGVMDAAVANNANGHMVITGTITELDTNAFPVNTVLYVATGGGWTSTPPAANSQAVAIVERSNTNNGAVIVKVNGLGSSGGNGASDANKLVRYNSTGGASLTGGTLTDMTYAGTAAFTSTTRPTSAGTGTPAATSLITRADGDVRYGQNYIAVKTVETARGNTNTPTSDPNLVISIPEAGSYIFEIYMRVRTSTLGGGTVSGYRFGVTYSGTATLRSSYIGWVASVAASITRGALDTFSSYIDVSSINNGENQFNIKGIIIATTAGDFALAWSPVLVNATETTILKPGSYINMTKAQ